MTDTIDVCKKVDFKIVKEDYWNAGKLIAVKYYIRVKRDSYNNIDMWNWVKDELGRRISFSSREDADKYVNYSI
jgi:hypothetical protein